MIIAAGNEPAAKLFALLFRNLHFFLTFFVIIITVSKDACYIHRCTIFNKFYYGQHPSRPDGQSFGRKSVPVAYFNWWFFRWSLQHIRFFCTPFLYERLDNKACGFRRYDFSIFWVFFRKEILQTFTEFLPVIFFTGRRSCGIILFFRQTGHNVKRNLLFPFILLSTYPYWSATRFLSVLLF